MHSFPLSLFSLCCSSSPSLHKGSDMVDWLHSNVEGFIDRRHARKYAALMLKHGFVRHTVNKITFSEQCYYVFGDFRAAAQSLPSGKIALCLSVSIHIFLMLYTYVRMLVLSRVYNTLGIIYMFMSLDVHTCIYLHVHVHKAVPI